MRAASQHLHETAVLPACRSCDIGASRRWWLGVEARVLSKPPAPFYYPASMAYIYFRVDQDPGTTVRIGFEAPKPWELATLGRGAPATT
jgi:hypothetical protein